jgi:uncharacterized protein (TIGR00106 family)
MYQPFYSNFSNEALSYKLILKINNILEGFIIAIHFLILPKKMGQKINIALQILPRGGTFDTYALVDKAIEVIKKSGVKYKVCPFETVMEGDYDTLMGIAKEAQQACFDAGADSMMVFIKIQRDSSEDVSIEDKMGKYE